MRIKRKSKTLALAIATVCVAQTGLAQERRDGLIIRSIADSAKVLESDTLQDIVVTSAGAARRLNKR